MQLIIAEKPQVGKAIAAALPGTAKNQDGCIVCGDYTVTWALGHLLDLKAPEDYDPELKTWALETLPIYFPDWQSKPMEDKNGNTGRKDRLAAIGRLLKGADSVIHAGDPDDEGQYLVDEILRWFKYKGPVYRMDTNDTTPAALRKAFANIKDNKPFESLGWSAHARRISDLVVGVNCSRYFSLKNPGLLLTVGRVQTATLGLVVQRDSAIEGHSKQKYYEVFADLSIAGKNVAAKYDPAKDDKNLVDGLILSENYARDKVDMLKNETLRNVVVTYAESDEQPPLPFNLTELQSYCSSHFGYDPSEVLSITQTLRDRHNAITYNRSDCRYLSEEQYREAPATMTQVIANISYTPKELDMTLHSKCFDDSNITAHTAIIPQNKAVDLNALSKQERDVYLAICKYYMAQFMPPARKGQTKLKAPLKDGGTLSATSTVILRKGYRALFAKDAAANDTSAVNELSGIPAGTYDADVLDARYTENETRPPSRYTKASLAKDMTRIAKYVEDPTVKALLLSKDKDKKGENGSIGTVATRAMIIDILEQRGYIEAKGKAIVSTPLGRELYRVLPDELKKPDMTAYWWAIQEDIQAGTADWTALTDSVMEMVRNVLHTEYQKVDMSLIPAGLKKTQGNAVALGNCPVCGKPVIEGKQGFGCSGYRDGCKFVVWKNPKSPLFQKTAVTAAQVKAWLNGGWENENGIMTSKEAVVFKKLFSESKNTVFTAKVRLRHDCAIGTTNLDIDFNAPKTVLGICPRCGGDIVEFSMGYGCTGHDSGCKFVIWKKPKAPMLKNTTFSAADVSKFLSGKPVKKSGLLRKDGKTKFSASLVMRDDPNSQYGPDFAIKG